MSKVKQILEMGLASPEMKEYESSLTKRSEKGTKTRNQLQ